MNDKIVEKAAKAIGERWPSLTDSNRKSLARAALSVVDYWQPSETAPQGGQLLCYSCGRPYEWGPDLVVSDENWERIKPPEGSSQVLCPNCMSDAFEALGVPHGSIEAVFTSGPFANFNWVKSEINRAENAETWPK